MTTSTPTQTATTRTATATEATTAEATAETATAARRTTGRVNFAKAAPKAFKALISLDAAAREGLDPALVELVQIRSSQLNHCAYCLHMHTADAHEAGESKERIALVGVWEEAGEAGFYTEKEQAALALTEAVTLLPGGVPDEVYERAARHFEERELAQLIALIFTINSWNRIAVTTRKVPGRN
ncbi:carboxymuconolactone decarboxylase family protein [Streptomyces sp. 110]|uniref:Carboxymuconolactone decarboxylase family protein n=1 Tax=Streptomyces endocoffeicus TaxID=2898945 RepID=A0ABS1Q1Y2_9ACTN|nr:carboxymuconolactone decarboxylase family protein [Streptomyces endocoffeicus]MBL1118678.1 carboxymuconolactone decarboxylase family protein [Streptomyces endocoffeicus]